MSKAPRFLTLPEILIIHRMQLAEFSGADGVRDTGMLESAMGRAENQWHYEKRAIPHLAAAYAFGLVRNHPFVDGNKRAALMGAYTFLRLNGYDLAATEAEAVACILALAAGELSEVGLRAWFDDHVKPPSA